MNSNKPGGKALADRILKSSGKPTRATALATKYLEALHLLQLAVRDMENCNCVAGKITKYYLKEPAFYMIKEFLKDE